MPNGYKLVLMLLYIDVSMNGCVRLTENGKRKQLPLLKRDMVSCANVPDSFAKRWQVIGEQGRIIWLNRSYLRIMGAKDHVFGDAAGGKQIKWFNLQCDEDFVQIKASVYESKARDKGIYVCVRIELYPDKILGYFIIEETSLKKKLTFDCEYWSNDGTRSAYRFHLTDHPTWVDLLPTHHTIEKADTENNLQGCHRLPRSFIGTWNIVGSQKMIDLDKKYYRMYSYRSSYNDVFWIINRRLQYTSIVCNPIKVILNLVLSRPDMYHLHAQCLVMKKDGEDLIEGHAVNFVTTVQIYENLESDSHVNCEQLAAGEYTRYTIKLKRYIASLDTTTPSNDNTTHTNRTTTHKNRTTTHENRTTTHKNRTTQNTTTRKTSTPSTAKIKTDFTSFLLASMVATNEDGLNENMHHHPQTWYGHTSLPIIAEFTEESPHINQRELEDHGEIPFKSIRKSKPNRHPQTDLQPKHRNLKQQTKSQTRMLKRLRNGTKLLKKQRHTH